MKSLIKVLCVALVLFASNTIYAGNGEPGFSIKKSGEKVLHFDGKEMMLQSLEISFLDEKGAVLFTEYVTDPTTFDRNYNLEELPNGQYFLQIKLATKKMILPVTIETEGLKIDLEQLKAIQ